MRMCRSKRDEQILETLTLKVHLFTLEQAAHTWWAGQRRALKNARERLLVLERAGLVMRHRVSVHPVLPMTSPVAVWSPGEAEPQFGRVAYRLQHRWSKPHELVTVYTATTRIGNEIGGFGGAFKHRMQLTHDIHLTEIYLRMFGADASVAKRWRGEDELRLLGEVSDSETLPDALLLNGCGLPHLIIEFGGRYDRRRVATFHHYCLARGLGYELW